MALGRFGCKVYTAACWLGYMLRVVLARHWQRCGRNESFILQPEVLTKPGVYHTADGPGATSGKAGTKRYFANSRHSQQYLS